ncbi:MAG: tetrathionate reductase family octaheme c-type cytochrome [Dechloromonas agitata]|uniref:Tetrathionate reductase family octaheme c-type cytochrome n=1 Tax=Dechloromonas agitata TaxID=73030 RepID=A0A930BQW2_9RHOO|nr:tetrathionate reductase family octaheme c-type cytochrome [Dechloromonas agitata]
MKFIKHALAAIAALAIITPALASTTPLNPKAAPQLERSTADHSKFKELQQTFTSGPEVTKACLACHNTAGHQVMKSIHWTWEANSPTTGKKLGKKWAANNFCGSIISNETRCTSCHAGYGWKDKDYDFTDQNNVDCLACHDTTGTYKKFGTDAGHPLYADREFEPMEGPPGKKQFKAPDLSKIAQHVGQPGRGNCGACHFNGGGGDAVKHGDLDSSLKNPSRELDVHMAKDGANMVCSDCHTFNAHQPSGSRYAATSKDKHGLDLPKDDHNHATCESCHGFTPHKEAKINNHTNKVACQTCHIPEFARGGIATKTLWDWSTAGKMDANGKPLFIKDDHGHLKYSAAKGDFAYGENVRPEYKWYNGVVHQIAITDKLDGLLDAKGVLELNRVEGSAKDPNARIWPFKVMHGKQPYDTGNNTLVVNHVYGDDDTSLWKNYDYSKSIKAGMEYAGLPYSGQFGFIETRMNWFITHMVAPKEKAVPCQECHTRAADGRLAAITDIYLPGRDTKGWLDLLGGLMIAGAIGGGVLHGGIRIATRRKEKAK